MSVFCVQQTDSGISMPCCSSLKSRPASCNSTDCRTPASPVFHYPPEFAQTSIEFQSFVYVRNGFPDGSFGKSACNTGDLSSIPGLGRFPGEGKGSPFQYSWASLVVQLVKGPPAMRETWVQSLGWEETLEKRKAAHCSILAWRIPWTRGHKESDATERLSLSLSSVHIHVHYFSDYFPIIGYYEILSLVSCTIQ